MKSRPSKQRILYLRIFVVAIILTVAAGSILTGFLGRVAEKGFKEGVDREAHIIASSLHENMVDVDNAAKSLSQAEQIVAHFSSGSPVDLKRANRLLDRYKSSWDMSVCYLLDRSGLVVASSNRKEVNGFVGKSFASIPFFTGALAGRLTTYFALGLITHERGYFAAAPVVDSSGTITGVVVVKRNIVPVGEFFRKYTHAFLVSPEGIIFISSKEELLFRSLWPVDERIRSKLLASRQFGKLTFEPLLAAEPRTETYVRFENEEHYVQRLPFGSDGWTLVFMDDPHIVSSYRLFGIILTIVFVFLILLFFNVMLYKDKSLEAVRDLLKSKDNWKLTFDTVPDLIAIIGADYRITSVNSAMAERLGISEKEAVGRLCYELLHGSQEPPATCPHQRMLDSGRTESGCRFENNLSGDFNVTAAPILAEDGTFESSVHVMHDVTEMKRLSEEVNRISNLESIGLLAGGLAHDFNNVLNIIFGNISFAKMLAGGNTAIVEPLTDAEEACERAKELGIRLQAFSQGGVPVKELLTLPTIIEDAAETQFKGSHISHTISAADDVLPVEADPRQIRQMFENLLTNAKDAMPDGGAVKINIENYEVDGKKGLSLISGRYVCITIQDDGPGIPEVNLPKIFDPYFSTKDTYSQRGMGLGLSICHAIMKRHNGQISVESTVEIGTRVTMYLPASVKETQLTPEG
jgi:PAS domain S-box-containing protein